MYVHQFSNYDLTNIYTPVNADRLESLLNETHYDHNKTRTIVNGFRNGFDLGYRGPKKLQQKSPNLKFVIGNQTELWNKVMDEVKLKRFAGPFDTIPYKYFIQSPIGLVPKEGGKKTRLIFHLSYPRNSDDSVSVNNQTPESLCKVKYQDFDKAVKLCIRQGKSCFAGKSDFTAAFRHLPIHRKFWKYLIMKARNPENKRRYYFIDKCLPFGSSRSCALFQDFSDCISHILKVKTGLDNVNYLDDFLFVALLRSYCNAQIDCFMRTCVEICFPVSLSKTFYGATRVVFLGLLIDTKRQLVCIPNEKLLTGLHLIRSALRKKKNTLWQLQQICGFLNFLGKAIVPGRAFTRRMYSHGDNTKKPHHHLPLTREIKEDLHCWEFFLETPYAFARSFFDFDSDLKSEQLDFATDASKNPELGAGGNCENEWFILQWNAEHIKKYDPSIAYLELFAMTVGIMNWISKYKNKKVSIACDNMAVVCMVNKTSSACKKLHVPDKINRATMLDT